MLAILFMNVILNDFIFCLYDTSEVVSVVVLVWCKYFELLWSCVTLLFCRLNCLG